jgi:hypothetical protein
VVVSDHARCERHERRLARHLASNSGAAYTVSAFVRGPLLGTVMIAAADTAGANIVGSVVGLTLSTRWQQFSFSYTAAANTTHRMVIRKTGNDTIGATPIYADGLQVELGSATTYIDGDQPGCPGSARSTIRNRFAPASIAAGAA